MQKLLSLLPALIALLATSSTVAKADAYSSYARSQGYLNAKKGDVEKFRKSIDLGTGKKGSSYDYKGSYYDGKNYDYSYNGNYGYNGYYAYSSNYGYGNNGTKSYY